MSRARAARRGALKNIADSLAHEADAFTPEIESVRQDLPGRQPGEALSRGKQPAPRSAAVILDIGTSRREGFTHVLWISPSASSVLRGTSLEAVGEEIAAVNGVTGVEWEAADHLHLLAPGRGHDELLGDVRDAVGRLLA